VYDSWLRTSARRQDAYRVFADKNRPLARGRVVSDRVNGCRDLTCGGCRDVTFEAARYVAAEQSADRLRAVAEAARAYSLTEPPCHCGEFAPGPCCPPCEADRNLRTALRALDGGEG
jgi:hypothetical protein